MAGSGPLIHRMTPAPLSISARFASVAPAASNSASGIEAASPAPFSTAISAPSAASFLTVSGMAAQRCSPSASFNTAIFIGRGGRSQDQKNEEADDQADNRAPFQQLGEA